MAEREGAGSAERASARPAGAGGAGATGAATCAGTGCEESACADAEGTCCPTGCDCAAATAAATCAAANRDFCFASCRTWSCDTHCQEQRVARISQDAPSCRRCEGSSTDSAIRCTYCRIATLVGWQVGFGILLDACLPMRFERLLRHVQCRLIYSLEGVLDLLAVDASQLDDTCGFEFRKYVIKLLHPPPDDWFVFRRRTDALLGVQRRVDLCSHLTCTCTKGGVRGGGME